MSDEENDDTLALNGIDGATGGYLLPDLTVEDVAKIAQGDTLDDTFKAELKARYTRDREVQSGEAKRHMGVIAGVDPQKLDEAGWGIVFAQSDGDRAEAIREALGPLLALRREQAGPRYREFLGADGCRPGEPKQKFLARHGMGPGPADPEKVPYYLLLVGSPEAIPFRFQYQLDVQYAVGRLHFETLEEYASYARTVVAAERGDLRREREVSLFGVQNSGDRATQMSAKQLVRPLAETLPRPEGWSVRLRLGDDATKANLATALAGDERPALFFSASHGMGFPKDDPRQLADQGALLCQDWPGPLRWIGQPIPEEHYFSAADVPDEAPVAGLVAFHFACYGAGTPRLDDFAHQALKERLDIAPYGFIARLPRRLLGHPRGGALAVVGHVERAWGSSFTWPGAGNQIGVFQSALTELLGGPTPGSAGRTVGSAMDYFNQRYAELSTELTDRIQESEFRQDADPRELGGLWTANNDARSYVILGDPAVRLAV